MGRGELKKPFLVLFDLICLFEVSLLRILAHITIEPGLLEFENLWVPLESWLQEQTRTDHHKALASSAFTFI